MRDLVFNDQDHTYSVDGVDIPGISHILKQAGLTDYSGVPEYVLEQARQFGTATHYGCELFDKGTLDDDSVEEPLKPYLNAWKQFRLDTGFKPMLIEKALHSEKHWFAGTLDRVGKIEGKLVVIEIKSTAKINKTTALQTAAHKILYEENFADKIDRRICVQLKKDGYKVKEYFDDDEKIFLAAKDIVAWKSS